MKATIFSISAGALLAGTLLFFTSCKNQCYDCSLRGEVQTVCSKDYSHAADFDQQIIDARAKGWECNEQ